VKAGYYYTKKSFLDSVGSFFGLVHNFSRYPQKLCSKLKGFRRSLAGKPILFDKYSNISFGFASNNCSAAVVPEIIVYLRPLDDP